MKYSELTGICKTAIETGMCLGCERLADPNFTGKDKCELVPSGLDMCKKILSKGEQMKL